MSKPFVVACIPAFNEEKTIDSVVIRATKYVDKVMNCEDGSVGLTREMAEGLGVVVVRHELNIGNTCWFQIGLYSVSLL